ncbi:hypothetical protein ACSSS7_005673 [Eimeria intestinalis]
MHHYFGAYEVARIREDDFFTSTPSASLPTRLLAARLARRRKGVSRLVWALVINQGPVTHWDVDLERSRCLAPAVPEIEEEILPDYEGRWYAFDPKGFADPTQDHFGPCEPRPGFSGPHLRHVVEPRFDKGDVSG